MLRFIYSTLEGIRECVFFQFGYFQNESTEYCKKLGLSISSKTVLNFTLKTNIIQISIKRVYSSHFAMRFRDEH